MTTTTLPPLVTQINESAVRIAAVMASEFDCTIFALEHFTNPRAIAMAIAATAQTMHEQFATLPPPVAARARALWLELASMFLMTSGAVRSGTQTRPELIGMIRAIEHRFRNEITAWPALALEVAAEYGRGGQ